MSTKRHGGEYAGHEWHLDDDNRFACDVLERTFGTYGELTQAVDDYNKRLAAQARKRLGLAGIASDGTMVTVTGIHARLATLLTTPNVSGAKRGRGSMFVVPHTRVTREAITERIRLLERLELLDRFLDGLHMGANESSYNFSAEKLTAALDMMEREHAAVLRKHGSKSLADFVGGV